MKSSVDIRHTTECCWLIASTVFHSPDWLGEPSKALRPLERSERTVQCWANHWNHGTVPQWSSRLKKSSGCCRDSTTLKILTAVWRRYMPAAGNYQLWRACLMSTSLPGCLMLY